MCSTHIAMLYLVQFSFQIVLNKKQSTSSFRINASETASGTVHSSCKQFSMCNSKNCVELRSIEFFDEKITMALYLYYSILTPWTVYYLIKIYCGGYVLSA